MDKLVGVLMAIHYDLALMIAIRVLWCIVLLFKDE